MTLPDCTWRCADDALDPAWCELFCAGLPEGAQALAASGMFDAPVPVGDESDAQTKLLARLGRDPRWEPEIS
ncbi:hypothetical protein [Mycobacterium sp. 1245852.3]|uniref:hypothetical protein n=1 Tax=Mycobacterium sp. 1245852.3 TaxID=1856860 RepID=UPI000B2ADACD|nr:hypothetical protein [Mycobacterium sp. 1245852.3]